MSDKNPCPFCGDDSEYLRFLDLCAERANKIWRENEVKVLTDVYKSMDFVQVVRCRDCKHFYEDRRDTSIGWVNVLVCDSKQWSTSSLMPSHTVEPDGFCAWGERRDA